MQGEKACFKEVVLMDPLRPLLTQQEALIPIQAPCFKKQPGDNFVIVLDGMPNGRMALLVRQIEVQIISQQQQPIPQTSAPQHGPHAPTQTALPPLPLATVLHRAMFVMRTLVPNRV